MRLWGLLPFLVPFILLWSIQEPELAEGVFISKYWVQFLRNLMGLENKTHCR